MAGIKCWRTCTTTWDVWKHGTNDNMGRTTTWVQPTLHALEDGGAEPPRLKELNSQKIVSKLKVKKRYWKMKRKFLAIKLPAMKLPGTKLPAMKLPGTKLPAMKLLGTKLPAMKLLGTKLPAMKLPRRNYPRWNYRRTNYRDDITSDEITATKLPRWNYRDEITATKLPRWNYRDEIT